MIGGKDAFLYREQGKKVSSDTCRMNSGLYDNLKVWEYMDFFCLLLRSFRPCGEGKRCTKLLEQVKLAGKEEFFVDSLSRGMKQRTLPGTGHDPRSKASGAG